METETNIVTRNIRRYGDLSLRIGRRPVRIRRDLGQQQLQVQVLLRRIPRRRELFGQLWLLSRLLSNIIDHRRHRVAICD